MSYAYPRKESAPVNSSTVGVPTSASQVYAAIAASRVSAPYSGHCGLPPGRAHNGIITYAGTWGSQTTVSGIRAVQAAPLLCNTGGVPTSAVPLHHSVGSRYIRTWVPQCASISECSNKPPSSVMHAALSLGETLKEDLSASVGSMDTTLGSLPLGGASQCSDISVNGDEFDLLSHSSISISAQTPSAVSQGAETDLHDVAFCSVMIDLSRQGGDKLPESPRLAAKGSSCLSSWFTDMPPMPKTPDVP